MDTSFSSAGLLYVYISGYEENGMLYMQQIDTYRYIGDELYCKIMETAELNDNDEKIIHIFGIVGPKKKTNIVYTILEDGIKENYQRILSNKIIKTNTNELDSIGNIFFRCVQVFYCNQPNHFPKKYYYDYDDIIFGGIGCSHMSSEQGDSIADAIVSLWLERENPMLCGQQLMTKSFFMRDFMGRKVIAALPETRSWRLIFEGGHQLNLSEDSLYFKGTLHPDDLGAFSSSNIQSILLNPIYAYGKWFQPNDICEEWHKVFLYLCAVSEKEWNLFDIRKVYEKFLGFLEKNICLTMETTPMISTEQYCRVLFLHITNFRAFLKGEDELVISKDLHQTLNSRYVYLPYLWSFVTPVVLQNSFSSVTLQALVDCALQETDIHKKGILWEDAAAYVLNNVVGWKITGRRIKAGAQEIDLSVANVSLDNELWQLGAYILVECKNWNGHVDIHQIRNIAHISNMKGNKTSILFAANGITSNAQEEIYRLAMSNIYVICITAYELKQLQSSQDCKKLVLNKWNSIQNNTEISTII